MLATILSLFGGRWRTVLLAGAGALLITLVAIQSARLGHAKADLEKERKALRESTAELKLAKAGLDTCTLDRTSLRKAVDTQNAAVAAQHAESEHTAALLTQALSQARETAAQADRKARALQTHQIAGADVCQRLLDVDRAITGR